MDMWLKLRETLATDIERPCITNQHGKCLKRGEVLGLVYGLVSEIKKNAVAGSRITVLNSHPFYDAISVLAVLAAGCVVVPMSLNYGEDLCSKIVNRVIPDIILTDIEHLPETILTEINKCNTAIIRSNTLLSSGSVEYIQRKTDDTAMIMFTSGTSGIPKGVILSHSNIISNLIDIKQYFKLSSEDHIVIPRPLYHAAVMTGEFLHSILCGTRITFYNELFSPKRLIRFISDVRCTVMCATPTIFHYLSIVKDIKNFSALKQAVVSGECLQATVARRLIESFPNVLFYNVFGLTEASPRVSYLPPEYFSTKIGSVGIPLKSVSIKIIDDTGEQVKNKTIGELLVKGPNVMSGYWNDSELSLQKIRNGWLYTGDLAYLDEDDFLYIIGRKDHMIIKAGMNIYPQEIENILQQNSSIKEALVWGEFDSKCGQCIRAKVVPQNEEPLTEEVVMEICRNQLPTYQCPDSVEIVQELPRNASGKII